MLYIAYPAINGNKKFYLLSWFWHSFIFEKLHDWFLFKLIEKAAVTVIPLLNKIIQSLVLLPLPVIMLSLPITMTINLSTIIDRKERKTSIITNYVCLIWLVRKTYIKNLRNHSFRIDNKWPTNEHYWWQNLVFYLSFQELHHFDNLVLFFLFCQHSPSVRSYNLYAS